MLKVFHAKGTRSLRVLWMAEEMGLPYEVVPETLGQPSDAFVAANPARAFPAVVDGEVTLSESVAIMLYLAARYGPTDLVPAATDPAYPDVLQYMLYGEGSLAAFLNPLVGTRIFAPDDQKENFTVGVCRTMFSRRVSALKARLAANPFLAGAAFSAADISVVYALNMGAGFGLADGYAPVVTDYWNRMRERPAYQRAAAQ